MIVLHNFQYQVIHHHFHGTVISNFIPCWLPFLSETAPIQNCHDISISRQRKYYLTTQVDHDCLLADGIKMMTFNADKNMEMDITFNLISTDSEIGTRSGLVKITAPSANESIILSLDKRYVARTIKSDSFELVIPKDFIILLGVQGWCLCIHWLEMCYRSYIMQLLNCTDILFNLFSAVGCEDFVPPPYTWTERKGSTAKIGCDNNNFSWTLKCIGSKWIGFQGNCTDLRGMQ